MKCWICRRSSGQINPGSGRNGFHDDCYKTLAGAVGHADIVVAVDETTGEERVLHERAFLDTLPAESRNRLKWVISFGEGDLEQFAAMCDDSEKL